MSRGLESLIPKKGGSKQDNLSKKESVFWIEIAKIIENPYQPRSIFNENELEKLAGSIKRYGILQPLIVTKLERRSDGGIRTEYELIAGERRLRACQKLGIDRVPVVIREQDAKEKLELALIENIQRTNLNPVEKAEAYLKLKEEFGLLEKEIAEVIGKSRESISNTLRILSLPKIIREALKNEMISEGHAKVLLSLEDEEERKVFLKRIIEEGLSVRKLEQEIKNYKNPKRTLSIKDKAYLEEFENKFKSALNFENIKVKNNKKKYQVIIDFDSEDEINKFIQDL